MFLKFLRYAQEVQVNHTLPIGSGILNKWTILKSILFFCFGLALPGYGYNLDSTIAHMCCVDEIPIDFGGMIFTEAMATTS